MKKKSVFVVLIIAVFTIIGIAAYVRKEKLVKIEAASAFYPYTAELVKNVFGESSLKDGSLKMVSTSQAYKDIIDRKTDVIVASGPSDEQKEMIKNSIVDLEFKTLYLEPLAILVNSENVINDISVEDIQSIYYSNKAEWNTYQLEKNNGSQTCFESIVKNNPIENNHYSIVTMPEIVDKVAEDKKGICYSFYSYYSKMHRNEGAKVINVNGRSVTDSDYPLLFEVYMIYRKDEKNDYVGEIIKWLENN